MQVIQVKEKVSSITSINLIIYCMIFNLLLFQQMELKVQTIHSECKKITSNQAVIQTPITNYVSRPLSTQDGLHFCKLFLIMIISDGI